MEEIDHAERELRRGQILWFRGLNRIQTQVWAWWRGRRDDGHRSQGLLDPGGGLNVLLHFLLASPTHKTYSFGKNSTAFWNE